MRPSVIRGLFAAIFVVALALRLVAGVWWQARLAPGQKFGFGDSAGYWDLARTIARGQPYELSPDHRIFRTPGYPAVLAPLFLLRDDPPILWARALSAVLSTLAVAGVAALAWILFNERTALIAAAMAAIYPEAISLGAFVLSEAPFVPLMMLQLICWTIAWRSPANSNHQMIGWSALSGIVAGLATLMRPSWLLFIPFAGLIGLFITNNRRRHVAIVCISMVGLCLTMTPWWIRNYKIAGRFVPTTLQVGASLYDGLSPTATGASDMRFVPQFTAVQRASDAARIETPRGTFEERLDNRMKSAALAWTAKNPGQALVLAGRKFVRMWNVVPNASEFQSSSLRLILAISYAPLVVLSLAAAWRFGRRDWPFFLCLLPAIYFTCLHVIFVSSIRYRQPALLPLIVLAAGALTHWRSQINDSSNSV